MTAEEDAATNAVADKALAGEYAALQSVSCELFGIAAVFDLIGTAGVSGITIVTNAAVGCGAEAKGLSVLQQNVKNAKEAESIVAKWLSQVPEFDCAEKERKYRKAGGLGKRFVDAVICLGEEKIGIEIKSGGGRYGGTLQEAKDLFLVETREFSRIILVRLKTFSDFMATK